jgi:hypothetical protein
MKYYFLIIGIVILVLTSCKKAIIRQNDLRLKIDYASDDLGDQLTIENLFLANEIININC